jgi:hypothetical protein
MAWLTRPRLSILRLRLTVAGAVLAAALFAIGGAVTITLYSRSLTLSAQHYTAATATAVAARVKDQWLPDPIPMPGGPGVPRVQVLDARGNVVTGDPSSAGHAADRRRARGLTVGTRGAGGFSTASGPRQRPARCSKRPAGPGQAGTTHPGGNEAVRERNTINGRM